MIDNEESKLGWRVSENHLEKGGGEGWKWKAENHVLFINLINLSWCQCNRMLPQNNGLLLLHKCWGQALMFIFKTGDIDPSLIEYYKFISIMLSNQSWFHCLIWRMLVLSEFRMVWGWEAKRMSIFSYLIRHLLISF